MAAIQIHDQTVSSLKLELFFDETSLAYATGYVIEKDGSHYLVSNYHVLAGRNPQTQDVVDQRGAIPNKVRIYHHNDAGKLGDFVGVDEGLIDVNGKNLFLTHSKNEVIDVAILPLTNLANVKLYPVKYQEYGQVDIPVWPSQDVVIIGFPFGLSSNRALPIWKTGHVASEIDLPFQGLPAFLVDAATRGGMSGSPVFALIKSPYKDRSGDLVFNTGTIIRFLGTYSGRLIIPSEAFAALKDEQRKHIYDLGSDLGIVWNWGIVDEIV